LSTRSSSEEPEPETETERGLPLVLPLLLLQPPLGAVHFGVKQIKTNKNQNTKLKRKEL
jgi:hypothetical protein